MKIINPLTGVPQPIQIVLRILASQENCDGEPYDQMCEAADYIDHLESQLTAKDTELERRRNLLENVVNELDLSEVAIEKHGPLGTEPAELVRLVLAEKDRRLNLAFRGVACLRGGSEWNHKGDSE